MTKATMLMSIGLMAGFAMADGMSIADARKQVADCVANPATMTAVVKQLPAAEQRVFLGDVVAAVAKMPGSQAEKAAAYVNVVRAGLKGSSKENLTEMIAEVFATVPPEYLPVVSESLAGDMVNRAIDPSRTYTDAEYIKIATNTMAVINERVASADAADVRSAFAALTFINGSNNASEQVVSAMVEALPQSAQKPAATEWFPAALAKGANRSYDAMLVAAAVDDKVTPQTMSTILLRVPSPVAGDMLLFELGGANTDISAKSSEKTPVTDAAFNTLNETIPSEGAGGAADKEPASEGVVEKAEEEEKPKPEPPGPYQNQNTGS